MHNLRWSDLEYVLAVAAAGSVAAAARQLNVNHSTVLRRVQGFENQCGVRIFDRLRSGYRVTAEGEMFLDAASSIDEIVQKMDRKIAGVNTEMSGEISITTTDSLFPLLIPPTQELQHAYPEMTFRLQVSNVRLNLDRRDADIAVRASVNPPAHLIGRKISDMAFGIYASKTVSSAQGDLPFQDRNWLGVDVPLMESVAAKWMEEHIPQSKIVFRSGSFVALAGLAEQNAGFVLLPRYVGEGSGRLVRTDLDTKTPSAELWILTHKDVLASPKIRLVTEKLFRHLRDQRARFSEHLDPSADLRANA